MSADNPQTLYDKIWDDHLVEEAATAPASSISTATSSTR